MKAFPIEVSIQEHEILRSPFQGQISRLIFFLSFFFLILSLFIFCEPRVKRKTIIFPPYNHCIQISLQSLNILGALHRKERFYVIRIEQDAEGGNYIHYIVYEEQEEQRL